MTHTDFQAPPHVTLHIILATNHECKKRDSCVRREGDCLSDCVADAFEPQYKPPPHTHTQTHARTHAHACMHAHAYTQAHRRHVHSQPDNLLAGSTHAHVHAHKRCRVQYTVGQLTRPKRGPGGSTG
jgi:hypothetical protein